MNWPLPSWTLRFCFYGIAVALLLTTLVAAVSAGAVVEVGPESGPVEALHLLLQLSSVVLFGTAFRRSRGTRVAAVFEIAAYGSLLGLLREADALFDHAFFKGAYKIPAAGVGVVALVRLWVRRRGFLGGLADWAGTPSGGLVAVGAFVVLVYAQIVGQKELWQAIMGAHYLRSVKDAAEELQELLGYFLIFFGAIEACFAVHGARGVNTSARNPLDSHSDPGRS